MTQTIDPLLTLEDAGGALRALLARLLVDEYLAELASPPVRAHDSAPRP